MCKCLRHRMRTHSLLHRSRLSSIYYLINSSLLHHYHWHYFVALVCSICTTNVPTPHHNIQMDKVSLTTYVKTEWKFIACRFFCALILIRDDFYLVRFFVCKHHEHVFSSIAQEQIHCQRIWLVLVLQLRTHCTVHWAWCCVQFWLILLIDAFVFFIHSRSWLARHVDPELKLIFNSSMILVDLSTSFWCVAHRVSVKVDPKIFTLSWLLLFYYFFFVNQETVNW